MSFDIELPDWLPPVLVVAVKRLHDEATVRDDTAKAIDRLRRLACDDRMKHVWRQLYKKKRESHRPTDTYLHPATFFWRSRAQWNRLQASHLRKKGGNDNEYQAKFLENEAAFFEQQMPQEPNPLPWSEQDLAVRDFFYTVHHYSDVPIEAKSRQEVIESMAERLQIAERLRTEAEKLRSLGMDEEAVLDLERQAHRCEEEAYWHDPDDDDPWLVERHSAEDELRVFIAFLSQKTRQLFGGSSLYGVLARVANVAFGRSDVTDTKVREFLRARDPGV